MDPVLLQGEVNVLRLSMHPGGLAPRILNFAEWRSHILSRLSHDIEVSTGPRLVALLDELKSCPAPKIVVGDRSIAVCDRSIAIPLIVSSKEGPREFLSTTTDFGTAVDVTLADIVIESFFPANNKTANAMTKLVAKIMGVA